MSKFAIVFPGQGSQSIGMLSELAAHFPVIQTTFSEASDVLNYDLWDLVQHGEESELNQTHRTQPALLSASVALWRVWQEKQGKMPTYLAGHSLGEYSALVCAGAIDFKEAVRLVELRGILMQEAVPSGVGAMSAIIGLANEDIIAACDQAQEGQIVSAVNFNSPGQVVIAGNKEAVERANMLCKAAGAKRALPLPISVPSHCALMKPAADKLAKALDEVTFALPSIPVINNVDVADVNTADGIKDALVRQLYHPVRWTETVDKMVALGVNEMVEMGPNKVLTGLIKRINKTIKVNPVNDCQSLELVI